MLVCSSLRTCRWFFILTMETEEHIKSVWPPPQGDAEDCKAWKKTVEKLKKANHKIWGNGAWSMMIMMNFQLIEWISIPYLPAYRPQYFWKRKYQKVGVRPMRRKSKKSVFFFFFLIYGAMPGNVSQLSNQCVDSPLGNYNNTQICLSSWFESNLSNRSQYVVYNNNSSIFFI